jgi:hypothetical protein
VVLYLDGFHTMKNYLKAKIEARTAKNENKDARQNSNEDSDENWAKREQDTQKSMDDVSDDDLNFVKPAGNVDPAVHEGGIHSSEGVRQSRRGGNRQSRRIELADFHS